MSARQLSTGWRLLGLCLIMGLTACPAAKPGTDTVDAGGVLPGQDARPMADASPVTDAIPGGDALPPADGASPDAEITADGGGGDALPDSGPSDGGAVSRTPVIGVSSGGGAGASTNYRLRLVVGAPSPAGSGSSASYRLLLGTGHAQSGQP
ncbi:MAG: hypothetical protein IT384_15450 [Deltaproteobacteria bacterium]|nr:hypothetical protein [Deltaproteobacteria bacterium]